MGESEESREEGMSAKRGRWMQIAYVVAVVAAITGFFASGLHHKLSIEALQSERGTLEASFAAQPIAFSLVFAGCMTLWSLLALPGIFIWMMAAGLIFGFDLGTAIVAVSTAFGSTLSFLTARYLFREAVTRQFQSQLRPIELRLERDGLFILVMLRIMPLIPYSAVNLMMGLTTIPARMFALVTLLSMTILGGLYVNAGTRLAELHSLQDVMKPSVILSLVALGTIPLAAKMFIAVFKSSGRGGPEV